MTKIILPQLDRQGAYFAAKALYEILGLNWLQAIEQVSKAPGVVWESDDQASMNEIVRTLELYGLKPSVNTAAEPTSDLPNLLNLTPRGFEEMVRGLLVTLGFTAELTKQTGDGGIDVVATRSDPFLAGRYIIQCKRWTDPVGEPIVRDLYGTVTAERANKGILVTTGTFTRQAHEFARGKPIELIDSDQLAELMAKALKMKR